MDTKMWYAELVKPVWSPPSYLFGPVWSLLYIVIAVTYGTVIYKVIKGEWPAVILIPFGLNLLFNVIFSPIQFGLQNNFLASIDIILILTTLIWAMAIIWPYAKWIALANIPYLLWVAFATILQLTITYLNWNK
jgi:tryptophan-rich sensory protein